MDELKTIEIDPEILTNIDSADRTEWNYELYVSVALEVGQVRGYSCWLLGKLASEVEGKWGSIKQFAIDSKVDPSSLRVYKHTYEKFIKQDKNFSPSEKTLFGLLQEAARTRDPIGTLKEFEKEEITTQPAARRFIGQKKGSEYHKKPNIKLSWNDELKQWNLEIADEDLPLINWGGIREKIVNFITRQN